MTETLLIPFEIQPRPRGLTGPKEIYARFDCTCDDRRYPEGIAPKTEIIRRAWDEQQTYANPAKDCHCGNCGREFTYRWTREGVEIVWEVETVKQ